MLPNEGNNEDGEGGEDDEQRRLGLGGHYAPLTSKQILANHISKPELFSGAKASTNLPRQDVQTWLAKLSDYCESIGLAMEDWKAIGM
jgi:hypothetical protein